MTEQQIKEEILRYIKDQTYNYAVLIDGEWEDIFCKKDNSAFD